MAYRLVKNNVERVFADDALKDGLLKDGWKEIKKENLDLNSLTVEQLKSLADEKEIEYDSKVKKDDLIKLLEGAK